MKTLPQPTHRQSTKRPVPVDHRRAPTTGPHITGRHKDKFERIAETASDLELVCKGAFSLDQRSNQRNSGRWIATLARASSVI